MIKGSVVTMRASDGTVILEPRVTLRVAGPERVFQTVEAVVDTGFTTYLTLPERTIHQLGLIYLVFQHFWIDGLYTLTLTLSQGERG